MTTTPNDNDNPRPEADESGRTLGIPELGSATMTAPPPGRDAGGGGDGDIGSGDSGGGRAPSDTTGHVDRLHRGGAHRMLAGVAVGLADYFDIDPTLVRAGFVVLSFLGGLAVPLYLAGWLLIPEQGAEQSVAEELLARERIR
jgi:phage shock protein PspC (stress-responsive transcriptional regulator)